MSKKEKQILFKLTCPLGYTIILNKSCWIGHILKWHDSLVLRQLDVEKTIFEPDEVREDDKNNRDNFTYWKRFDEKDKLNPYLKVAVMINKHNKEGLVTSAYPVTNIYGGKKIWPK